MAGSYKHCEADDGSFRFDLIENMGDAHEACLDMFNIIKALQAEVERYREVNDHLREALATERGYRAEINSVVEARQAFDVEFAAMQAEVERLKVFETAVIVYAISVFEFESAEIGQDVDQRMEMDAAERALLALVPAESAP